MYPGQLPPVFHHFHQTTENSNNSHKLLKAEFVSQLDKLRDGLLQIYGSNSRVKQLLDRANFVTLIALIGFFISNISVYRSTVKPLFTVHVGGNRKCTV